jgi:acetyl-CoA carboxylase biotin carboxylase subunit
MIKRILVANRGEIAVRIIRACRDMNIETVAVYSLADKNALFVTLATQSVCIGPGPAAQSYLKADNIIAAALQKDCDAIHPGFGFLAENADFARAVQDNGLIFIGPDPATIEMLGDKISAKKLMREHQIPVVPGSLGIAADLDAAKEVGQEIGYPLLIKASSGGGGRGMRKVMSEAELADAFDTASAEALACFGDASVYIERLIVDPKHIEVQILADHFGNIIHLGERECSLQRNNQKMFEEAPAKTLNQEQRQELGEIAVRVAAAANYKNAGTVEFVLDQQGNFYFIEMNTRIQVEHPVTEMVTGIDIVREQIRIASQLKLGYQQEDIVINGHAIECRINAEDPENNFASCPGTIDYIHFPGGFGVRIDSALYSGCKISPYYDSMIAKVIVHGKTRNEAILRMRRTLEELLVEGVKTNLGLLYMILYAPEFITGTYNTGFIEKNLDTILKPVEKDMRL